VNMSAKPGWYRRHQLQLGAELRTTPRARPSDQTQRQKMSGLRRLWTKIARIAEVLESMDDPTGDYIFSLGKRVDRLERDLEHLEGKLHSRPGVSRLQQ
jgi:hypothetical protein